MRWKYRILLACGDDIRTFLSFEINGTDGSLYITFVREGESRKTSYYHLQDPRSPFVHIEDREDETSAGFDVHYHTTGRINYRNANNPTIIAEPLTAVTQNFWFGSFVIPNFNRLDLPTSGVGENDFVLPIDSTRSGRTQLDLCISRFGFPITTYGLEKGHFSWSNFYTLNVIVVDQPIPDNPHSSNMFSLCTPRRGLYERQQIDRNTALIRYQQRMHGHSGPIMYGPDQNGIFKLIFPVPALTEPQIITDVAGLGLTIEILDVKRPAHDLGSETLQQAPS